MSGGRALAQVLLAATPWLVLAGCVRATAPTPAPLSSELTTADAATADQAMQRALETLVSGTMTSWSDPDQYVVGTIMPLRTFRTASGLYCREFEESISIRGAVDRYQLVGCRSPAGTWRPAATPGDKGTTLAAGS
jgi:hypothetical protein